MEVLDCHDGDRLSRRRSQIVPMELLDCHDGERSQIVTAEIPDCHDGAIRLSRWRETPDWSRWSEIPVITTELLACHKRAMEEGNAVEEHGKVIWWIICTSYYTTQKDIPEKK